MNRTSAGLALLALSWIGASCVDPGAGAGVLQEHAAIVARMDQVSRGLPRSPLAADPAGDFKVPVNASPGTASHVITMAIANLPPLDNAQYQVWLVDQDGAQPARRISALLQLQRPDTIGFDPTTEDPIIRFVNMGDFERVESFNSPPVQRRHVLRVVGSDVAASGTPLAAYTHVVLTIGSGGDASPSTAPAPSWYRFRTPGQTPPQWTGTTGEFAAVRFGFRGDAPGFMSLPWSASGAASVEFLHTFGFGMLVEKVSRPPRGFYYEAWLTHETGARAPLKLGTLTTPSPEFRSLADADVALDPAFVSPTLLIQGIRWAEWADLGVRWNDYTNVVLTLRSKHQVSDATMPPAIIYSTRIPARLDVLPREVERKMKEVSRGR
jgi:hypothetical protein